MRSILLAAACWIMLSTALPAQDVSGTVNSMSVDPTQNQKLTGTLATTTGQPNDVTPGSENMPNGLVPVTTNMKGSGSNGNMNQPVAGMPSSRSNAATAANTAKRNNTQAEKKPQPSHK